VGPANAGVGAATGIKYLQGYVQNIEMSLDGQQDAVNGEILR